MSEEQDFIIGARIDNIQNADDTFKKNDPFNKTWDELKSLSGLENNFKRRAARMSKVDVTEPYLDSSRAISSGLDGAKSKAE